MDPIPNQVQNQQPVMPAAPAAPLTQILKEPPASQSNTPTSSKPTEKEGKTFLGIFPGEGLLGTVSKLMFFLVSFLGILLLTVAFMIATKLDTQIYTLKLEGVVLDKLDSAPIAEASIILNGERVAVTDSNGHFKVDNLNLGNISLQIASTGYETTNSDVLITRSLFSDYTTEKIFYLENTEVGTVEVRLIANNETYDFSNDILSINDEPLTFSTGGNFKSGKLREGTYTLTYESNYYEDFKKDITITKGVNKVQDIALVSGGSITGELLSYIEETPITKVLIQVQNIPPEDIILEENKFVIDNLDVGTTYNIRIIAEGYVTRDYSLEVKQGINQLADLKMVEKGGIYYINQSELDNENQIYFSEYDGQNLRKISSINENLEAQDLYYDSVENLVYFLSDAGNFISNIQGRALVAYSINLEQNTLNQVTTNTSTLGILVPNFKAKKLINITEIDNNSDTRRIMLMDLGGDNRKNLKDYEDAQIYQAILSDNGEYIYYVVDDLKTDEYGLYKIRVETSEVSLVSKDSNIKIWSVSENGDRVLFTSQTNSDSNVVLKLYNLETSEVRTIFASSTGSDYQFLEGSDNVIIYWDNKNNRDNLYSHQIQQNQTDQVTNLGFDDEIEFIYQQNKYIFYKTERGFYVIDYVNPHTFKLVSTEENISNPRTEFVDED